MTANRGESQPRRTCSIVHIDPHQGNSQRSAVGQSRTPFIQLTSHNYSRPDRLLAVATVHPLYAFSGDCARFVSRYEALSPSTSLRSQFSEPRENLLGISVQKPRLIWTRRVKNKVPETEVDVAPDLFDVFIRI